LAISSTNQIRLRYALTGQVSYFKLSMTHACWDDTHPVGLRYSGPDVVLVDPYDNWTSGATYTFLGEQRCGDQIQNPGLYMLNVEFLGDGAWAAVLEEQPDNYVFP
jgi:hypothetical protein